MANTKTIIDIMVQNTADKFPHGGETLGDFKRRVQDRLNEIVAKSESMGGPFCFPVLYPESGSLCFVIQWMEMIPEKTN